MNGARGIVFGFFRPKMNNAPEAVSSTTQYIPRKPSQSPQPVNKPVTNANLTSPAPILCKSQGTRWIPKARAPALRHPANAAVSPRISRRPATARNAHNPIAINMFGIFRRAKSAPAPVSSKAPKMIFPKSIFGLISMLNARRLPRFGQAKITETDSPWAKNISYLPHYNGSALLPSPGRVPRPSGSLRRE